MAISAIEPERIRSLNDRTGDRGGHVVYWMQQSQRAAQNHALEYAIEQANGRNQPVVVAFGLMADYPHANARHFTFMLEGLRETQKTLEKRGIGMVIQRGHPVQIALQMGQEASMIVADVGYLRHQRQWRREVAGKARCPVRAVEADVVVPVAAVSRKAEYAARTIRPKIHRQKETYLRPLRQGRVKRDSLGMRWPALDISDVAEAVKALAADASVGPVSRFWPGGTKAARRQVRRFVEAKLARYVSHRNKPEADDVSGVSPYLHFGQISPVEIVLAARKAGGNSAADQAIAAFEEQLIVRRELARNFTAYQDGYDAYATAAPGWAKATLKDHRDDPRQAVYSKRQFIDAQTHDPYWNAAMREMVHTGYMHNYMRMYWGKKILEWTRTPEYAHRLMVELNDRYFLDGRDPSGYANIAWVFGRHDRPWPERTVYGKVRSMTKAGLQHKCDAQGYVAKVDRLVQRAMS